MGCWFLLSFWDLLLHSWGPVWELFLPQWVFSIKCNNYKQRWHSNQRSIKKSKLKQRLYPFYFRVFFQPAVSMYSSSSILIISSSCIGCIMRSLVTVLSWSGLSYYHTAGSWLCDSSMTRSSIWPQAVLFASVWSRNLIKFIATSNNEFKDVSAQYLVMD